MAADHTPIPFEGRAIVRGLALRIEGKARYPNDYSTATLEPVFDVSSAPAGCQAFAVVFHRDKEPFCDLDLIGPVVYYGLGSLVAHADVVRVYVTPDLYEDIRIERHCL